MLQLLQSIYIINIIIIEAETVYREKKMLQQSNFVDTYDCEKLRILQSLNEQVTLWRSYSS